MTMKMNRRQFLHATAAFAATAAASSASHAATAPLALIGCGGRGLRLLETLKETTKGRDWIYCDHEAAAVEAARALRPGVSLQDWTSALAQHRPAGVLLAAPATVNAAVLRTLRGTSTPVYCDGLLAGTLQEARELTIATRQVSCTLHARHPWQAHAAEAARLIQSGALGELRWSQICVAPVSAQGDSGETLLRHALQSLDPLFQATGAGIPDTVKTLGIARAEDAASPESFTTEFRFGNAHTMLLQCTRANPAGQWPVIRGTLASLEFRADHLALIRHNSGAPPERIPVAAASSLDRWISEAPGSGRDFARSVEAQYAACLALEDFSRQRTISA